MRKVKIYGLAMYYKKSEKRLIISFIDVGKTHHKGNLDVKYKKGMTEKDIKKALVDAKIASENNIEISGHILYNLPLTDEGK